VRGLECAAGLFAVLAVLSDVFQSVLSPRAAGLRYRLSARLTRSIWPTWRRIGLGSDDAERREDIIGSFAPSILIVFLLTWLTVLIFGWGLVFFALSDQIKPVPQFGGAVYFAGTSLLTIGYGDYAPTGNVTRALAVICGASGFGVVAVVTTFLFSIFGAFQQRETFVVTFGTPAGAPPSGVSFLETYGRLGITADLPELFVRAQTWSAALLDTHLAYPVLAYFRSSHDGESWVATLGAMLDASTLLLTTVDESGSGQAKLANELGRHLVHDLGTYFRLDVRPEPGIERYEFDLAHERLAAAGYPVREREDAWLRFTRLRALYAPTLNAMARFWGIPPALWIGDRSSLPVRHGVAATKIPKRESRRESQAGAVEAGPSSNDRT